MTFSALRGGFSAIRDVTFSLCGASAAFSTIFENFPVAAFFFSPASTAVFRRFVGVSLTRVLFISADTTAGERVVPPFESTLSFFVEAALGGSSFFLEATLGDSVGVIDCLDGGFLFVAGGLGPVTSSSRDCSSSSAGSGVRGLREDADVAYPFR